MDKPKYPPGIIKKLVRTTSIFTGTVIGVATKIVEQGSKVEVSLGDRWVYRDWKDIELVHKEDQGDIDAESK